MVLQLDNLQKIIPIIVMSKINIVAQKLVVRIYLLDEFKLEIKPTEAVVKIRTCEVSDRSNQKWFKSFSNENEPLKYASYKRLLSSKLS